jgi:hypothetical protein
MLQGLPYQRYVAQEHQIEECFITVIISCSRASSEGSGVSMELRVLLVPGLWADEGRYLGMWSNFCSMNNGLIERIRWNVKDIRQSCSLEPLTNPFETIFGVDRGRGHTTLGRRSKKVSVSGPS